ncbi:hypothetical protein [Rhodococcus tibetensis]|uniref:Uncharacterized protein n=1 Tax=Rhodococcus tibetensis TaxID=2965064 RepID=A0ABT1QIN2_9NOCA|nr:hypothetical protein [Rhodococcus sp. FXJ9.536]MCQ4122111.1 hypothetical protein [Rhodococcus sp. FXJ9.536]
MRVPLQLVEDQLISRPATESPARLSNRHAGVRTSANGPPDGTSAQRTQVAKKQADQLAAPRTETTANEKR